MGTTLKRAAAAVLVLGLAGAIAWGFLRGRREAAREARSERPVRAAASVLRRDGRTFVVLDSAVRRAVGIRLAAADTAREAPELPAYGRAVELGPLTDARDRYAGAAADSRRAAADLQVSRAEYRRVEALHADGQIVPERRLEQARAAFRADQAAAMAAARKERSARAEALEEFGPVLGRWLIGGSGMLDSLLAMRRVLLKVTLPPPLEVASAPDSAAVLLPSGDTVRARFLSEAPRTDPRIQGQSLFYLAPTAPGFRVGATVEVRLRPAGRPSGAALVPPSAVILYEGRPWVYAEGPEDQFGRRPVALLGRTGPDYVATGVRPGTVLVTRGAALVLSQEAGQGPAAAEGD